MEETKSGIGSWGLVIVIFLLFVFMRQGFGNGFGWGNGYGFPVINGDGYPQFGFQNYCKTCESEKTELRNFADTQHQIAVTSAATQSAIYADGEATRNLITQQEIQGLRERLDDAHRENLVLTNQLFVKEQLAPITAQLNSIQSNMLMRPNVTGVGAVCPNAGIINGLGINGGCPLGGIVA